MRLHIDSPFLRQLRAKELAVVAELSPPASFDLGSWLQDAATLRGLVDCIQLTDMPGARVHMDSLVPAMRLHELGFEVMLTMASRDRNAIAQQARILAAGEAGVSSIFWVLGDPVGLGDHPEARPVFERDTLGWLGLTTRLRDERKLASGRAVGGASKADFLIGASMTPDVGSLGEVVANFEAKQRAGADYFMTQPIFDFSRLRGVLDVVSTKAPPREQFIIAGIATLTSFEVALELAAFPGICIPASMLDELKRASPAAQTQLGIKWARELILELQADGRCAGVLLYPMAAHAQHIAAIAKQAGLR